MNEILRNLHLENLIPRFEENEVGPKEALLLTDEEFGLLGVSKIGDRARIRQKCRSLVSEEKSTLPGVKKLREMLGGKSMPQKVDKRTLRVYAGWKHQERYHKSAKQVALSRGGGTKTLDIFKDASLSTVLNVITDIFFPDGINKARGLELKDLRCSLITFSGEVVEDTLKSGSSFFLEGFFKELNTHPVRLYLQTSYIEEQDEESDDSLPEMNKLAKTERSSCTSNSKRGSSSRCCTCSNSNNNSTSPEQDQMSTTTATQPDTPTITFPKHLRDGSELPSPEIDPACGGTYQAYVNLLDDTDDADIELAVAASLDHELIEDVTPQNTVPGEEDILREVIKDLAALVSKDDPATVVVHRRRILSSTMRAVNSAGFNFWMPLKVSFAGEEAEDGGGPRREFFKLLMKEVIRASGIFECHGGQASFTYNLKLLGQKTYKLAGQFVVWSIANGGPGICSLCPSVYACLTGQDVDLRDIASVPNATARENIEQLMSCSSSEEFRSALSQMSDWLIDQGVTNIHRADFSRKEQLVKDLLNHQLRYRVQSCIEQFQEGLGPLAEKIRQFPKQLESLFLADDSQMSVNALKRLYDIEYSPVGSNNRLKEDDTIYSWEMFLQSCAGHTEGLTISDILDFWTAADRPPPGGFEERLKISFYPMVTGIRRLPSSNTCVPVLWLPRGMEDPDEFQSLMTYAIQETQGFGKV